MGNTFLPSGLREDILKIFNDKVFDFVNHKETDLKTKSGTPYHCTSISDKVQYIVNNLEFPTTTTTPESLKFFFSNRPNEAKLKKNCTSNFFTHLKNVLIKHNEVVKKHPVHHSKNSFVVDSGDLEKLDQAINHFRENINKPDGGKGVFALPNNWFSEKTYPESLENTEWYVFERIGGKSDMSGKPISKSKNWGVSVSEIDFHEQEDDPHKYYLGVRYKTFYGGEERINLKGWATKDHNQNYLYVDLITAEPDKESKDENSKRRKKQNYFFRSNMVATFSNLNAEQTVFVGHYTYPSYWYGRLLTKTVLLIRKDKIEHSLTIKQYFADAGDYDTLPLIVRRFLFDRQLNRLNMPPKPIGDIGQLRKFLKDQEIKKYDTKVKSHFLGKYTLYYKREGNIVKDSFEIIFEKTADNLFCKYSHTPDIVGQYKPVWLGRGFVNTLKKSLILELSRTNNKDEDPILVILKVPDDELSYSNTECFSGTISGLRDSNNNHISTGVAYLCFVVKDEVEEIKKEEFNKALNIFFSSSEANNSIKVPAGSGYMLADYQSSNTENSL